MKKILFITWDSPQTDYLESLFLPIFLRLRKKGFKVYVLQFSWGEERSERRKYFEGKGVEYFFVSVYRKPIIFLGALISSLLGVKYIRKIVRENNIDIIISRSTLPSLSTLIYKCFFNNVKWIVDADGFPIEERLEITDSIIKKVPLKILKKIESLVIKKSDKVMTRTEFANEYLSKNNACALDKFSTVVNGRDEKKYIFNQSYRVEIRNELNISDDSFVFIYVGSLGGKYKLKEMVDFFNIYNNINNNSFFIILTKADILCDEICDSQNVIIKSVQVSDVSKYLSAADLGLSFIQSSFSMKGAVAVKLGEYLLNGLPVVASANIGNSNASVSGAGFLLNDFSVESLYDAISWLDNVDIKRTGVVSKKAYQNGMKYYSLDSAVDSYYKVIKEL